MTGAVARSQLLNDLIIANISNYEFGEFYFAQTFPCPDRDLYDIAVSTELEVKYADILRKNRYYVPINIEPFEYESVRISLP